MLRSMTRVPAMLAAIPLIGAGGCATPQAEPLNPIEITEWEVPFGGHPRDPYVAGEDAIWFVGQRGDYLARFTPSEEDFFKRDLDGAPGPHNLIVGQDGIVWFAGNLEGYIGRYDPRTDEISKIPMPDPAARDPHTLVFDADQQHLWFTVQNGNFVGRLTLEDQAVELIEVPTPNARPYGIKMAPDGMPWVVLLGTHKLARIDPGALSLEEIVLPDEGMRPRRLVITEDGRIWYGDYNGGHLGLYDPASGRFDSWQLPSGEDAAPYGMALDEAGRVWVVETGVEPNQFIGFDTAREEIVSITPVPSGAGSIRHMDYFPPSDTIWFGTDYGTLGRADVAGRAGEG